LRAQKPRAAARVINNAGSKYRACVVYGDRTDVVFIAYGRCWRKRADGSIIKQKSKQAKKIETRQHRRYEHRGDGIMA